MPRLDPLALPVRFTAPDAAADGRVRLVEINRERVMLSRSVRGMAIRMRVPVTTFRGIAARAVAAPEGDAIVLTLEHPDAALSVDVFAASDDSEILAEWQLWGRVLGLPLLAAGQFGAARDADGCGHAVAAPRRRRSNAIKSRRPRLPLRRKPGRPADDPAVYRGREIIARN